MNKFSALLFLFLGLQVFSCENLLDTDVKILNQKEYKNLCEYSDHTLLVVNTAGVLNSHINFCGPCIEASE